ncbi:MAG TPA: hypothetical protein VL155_05305 [Terriglobales bacterium]|jgi:hypothetical protein|nr:hypothetical protein [Terriglobales bacterium]
MQERLKFLHNPYSRAALGGLAVLILTGASLSLVRPDRRIVWVQGFAAAFYLLVIVLLVRSKGHIAGDSGDTETLPFHPVLIFLLPAMAYLPALGTYFVSDDFAHLAQGRFPLLPFIARQLSQGQMVGSGYHLFFRPLGFASLTVDYRLFHDWAPGYHLVNLALHLAVVAAVYFLSLELGFPRKPAAMAALLFGIAPITVEPVTYIAARFDLLAATLGIWSLVAYLRFLKGGSAGMYSLALLLFFVGTFAKESIYVLPLLLVWLEVMVAPTRKWKAVGGFFAVAAATFAWRWRVLHGIGGYQSTPGAPDVLQLGRKTFAALLLRAPSETLMGYNWHQPPPWRIVAVAAATTAVLFSLLLISRPGPHFRRLAWFALGWMVIAVVPVHFLLWNFDPALLWSRVLYIGAIGMALLLAALLSGIADGRPRRAAFLLLPICFLFGLWHNLSAWQANSRITRQFLAALPRLEPSPPPNAEFLITGMPIEVCGVRFFLIGLGPGAQLAYGRQDLWARHPYEPPLRRNDPTIALRWTGRPPDFVVPTQGSPPSGLETTFSPPCR